VLFLAASGRFPFEGDEGEIARKKLMEESPKLDLGRIDRLTLQYSKVIARAIRRRPEERYQRSSELHEELLVLRDLAATMPPPRTHHSPYPPAVEAQSGKGWQPGVPVTKSSGMLPAISMPPERASPSQPPLLLRKSDVTDDSSGLSNWALAAIVIVFVLGLIAFFAYAVT
jgi:serine/threonine protein kinase